MGLVERLKNMIENWEERRYQRVMRRYAFGDATLKDVQDAMPRRMREGIEAVAKAHARKYMEDQK